jgi:hypothetical protein
MKTSSRALIGFGIGIAVLVILTIVLVLTLGQRNPTLLPENTPQGTVQRYLVAIQEKEYQKAFGYLAPLDPNDPNYIKEPPYVKDYPLYSYEEWLRSAGDSGDTTWKANLGKVNISGESAYVEVIIEVFRPGGPFDNAVHTNKTTFTLKKAESGWLIIDPRYLYWRY